MEPDIVKIVYDGNRSPEVQLGDKRIRSVKSVKFKHEAGSKPVAIIEIVGPEVELEIPKEDLKIVKSDDKE